MLKYTKILLSILFVLLVCSTGWADTHTAASCSRADVNTAYTAASANDTVLIPTGECDWGTTYITVSSTKPVKFTGAGNSASGTVITCSNTSYGCFRISTGVDPAAYALEISNMRMIVGGGVAFYMQGTGYGWRIHDNYIYKSTPNAVISLQTTNTGGDYQLFGLIDNNTLYNIKILPTGVAIAGGSADQSWSAAAQWGTNNAIFVENNTFYGPDKANGLRIDSNGGARMVIRYNDFNDSYIMAHSPCESTIRGTKSYEIYNNKMASTVSDSTWAASMYLRSGSHTITRNQILGYWVHGSNGNGSPLFDNRRSSDSSCYTAYDGACDGDSAYDTNTDATGWRCLDQIGAGLQTGTMGSSGTQGQDPVYVWSNVAGQTCVGGSNIYKACTTNDDCPSSTCSSGTLPTVNTPVVRSGSTDHIKKDRDYYESARPDWTPYTCPHPLADPLAQGACATTGDAQYGRAGYTLTGGESDETAPTVTSVYVTGSNMAITFSEPITAADDAAFTLDPSGEDVTVDCPAVATASNTMTCTISRALVQSETATYAYTGAKVADSASNALAEISTTNITGNLTDDTPPTALLTVTKTGSGCTITSLPAGVNCGSTCTLTVSTGTAVTLNGWSENGWNAITYGGDCAANGTVTMSAAKECTATCTEIKLNTFCR